MGVVIILFIGLIGLAGPWIWAEYERNKREDKLKERIDNLERWVENVQKRNNF